MGRFIIKAAPDVDLYMEWSTIVDAPTFIGTRADVLYYLSRTQVPNKDDDPPEVRVRRADATGTSAIHDPASFRYTGPLTGAWDDRGFVVEQRGWLPRAKLAAFLRAYCMGNSNNSRAYALLEPLEV